MREKQRKTVEERINKDKQKFLEILEKTPVIQAACERTGISRATLYRWKESDKEFAGKVESALSEGNSLINDIAIAQLISAIKEKNFGAIKFWLQNHHPDYANKLHIDAKVEQEIALTPDQEETVRRALELVSKPNTSEDGI